MTIEQMTEMARNLGENDRCPLCRDRGLISCYAHLVNVEDGLCAVCDSPDTPGLVTCLCQDA